MCTGAGLRRGLCGSSGGVALYGTSGIVGGFALFGGRLGCAATGRCALASFVLVTCAAMYVAGVGKVTNSSGVMNGRCLQRLGTGGGVCMGWHRSAGALVGMSVLVSSGGRTGGRFLPDGRLEWSVGATV